MSRSWVRLLWWGCLIIFVCTALLGSRLEDTTGLPIGPGSLVLLLLFAAWRAIDWFLSRREHQEHELTLREPEPQTVEMALQRVQDRRAGRSDIAGDPPEPRDT